MMLILNEQQKNRQQQAKEFCQQWVSPRAGQFDRDKVLPFDVISDMARAGFLGALTPQAYGGQDYDLLSFGLLNEEFGKACISARSLLTVHSMVQYAIAKWGNDHQKAAWLHELSSGSTLGAFALSEPNIGSDGASVETSATKDGEYLILNGQKKWISFGQIANVFLLFAHINNKPVAVLVESNTPGIRIEAIDGLMGCKASMLAHIHLEDCRIPKTHMLGGPGFGFSAVALSALDIGRYSVASGCVGLAQACLDICSRYSQERTQFGQALDEFQLIRRLMADMSTETIASRLLYAHSAQLRMNDDPTAGKEIMRAKYYAGKMANNVTRDAIQILGAQGYCDQYPLERHFRDAKAMEIIEGSNEMLQLVLGKQE